MPLVQRRQPFDHPDWLFELKYDGFRALAYLERGAVRLVSRKGNTYKSFPTLCQSFGACLNASDAVLDGEIVYLGPDGKPQFHDLMRRRGPQYFYAFDLLWLNGCDHRGLPLLERKRRLREIVAPAPSPLLSVPASICSRLSAGMTWRALLPSGATRGIRRKSRPG